MDELARLLSTSKETSMTVSKEFINDKLNEAQQLLWGGSETENIAAHNIIAKLIKDLQDEQ
jgi:tetrahydromethanopterin S-methyltransferase subunit A